LKQFSTNTVLSAAPFVVLGAKNIKETDPESAARELATLPPLEEPIATLVRDKIVFVGANASGTTDLKATPVGKIEPGALIHFTAWANAERGDFIRTFPRFTDLLASAVLIFAIILVGWRYSNAALVVGVSGALELILFVGSFAVFRSNYFSRPRCRPSASGWGCWRAWRTIFGAKANTNAKFREFLAAMFQNKSSKNF